MLQTDQFNHLLRRVNLTSGLVTTVAGSLSGIPSTNFGFADGIGTAARFYIPVDVAVYGAGSFAVVVSVGVGWWWWNMASASDKNNGDITLA